MLMPKLRDLFISYIPHKQLLEVESTWSLQQPEPVFGHPIDVMQGPLLLDDTETVENQIPWLQSYLKLHEANNGDHKSPQMTTQKRVMIVGQQMFEH
jgi:hypothetical protein